MAAGQVACQCQRAWRAKPPCSLFAVRWWLVVASLFAAFWKELPLPLLLFARAAKQRVSPLFRRRGGCGVSSSSKRRVPLFWQLAATPLALPAHRFSLRGFVVPLGPTSCGSAQSGAPYRS
jgi:hypothetical protein